MGDAGLGIISAWHYDYKSNAPLNVEFVKVFNEMHGRNPDFFSIGGYDGMHAIYETLKKTGGKTDGDALIAAASVPIRSSRAFASSCGGDRPRGAARQCGCARPLKRVVGLGRSRGGQPCEKLSLHLPILPQQFLPSRRRRPNKRSRLA